MQRLGTRFTVLAAVALAAVAIVTFAGCGTEVSPPEVDAALGADGVAMPDERAQILAHVKRDDLSEQEVRGWIDFAEDIKEHAKRDLTILERIERAIANPWVFFGFAAQGIFMMRFVVQLIASERKRRSYVPVAFWYLSLVGGLMLFTYALQRRDPVFVFGQGLGIFIYARNLILIKRRQAELEDRQEERAQRQANPVPVAADSVDTP